MFALVRDLEKAKKHLGEESNRLRFIEGDVRTKNVEGIEVDYIIHTASPTASKYFVESPADTILSIVEGTKNMLEFARSQNLKRFIYLSTMEVYGAPETDEIIDEMHSTNLNTMEVRSCYPESKRLCENMCVAYMKQYGIPVNVLRLTQTFGPGVQLNDGRVFAYFAKCVLDKTDIVLKTKGETKRSYLHIDDAISAIKYVMEYANAGEVYNVANENTYCSIFEMASMVAEKIAQGEIKVVIEEQPNAASGFAPTLRMNLDTTKLKKLGWNPQYDLYDMFEDMIEDLKKNAN